MKRSPQATSLHEWICEMEPSCTVLRLRVRLHSFQMLCRFRMWVWWRTHPIPTPLVLGIEAKTFWQGPCRWTSYPAPYGFPDSASLKGDKDRNLKFFIDTLKFTAVLCLGERYRPIFLDANWIPSLSPCLFFLVPVIPLVCTQIFLQFCSFENITHHGMRLNKEFW